MTKNTNPKNETVCEDFTSVNASEKALLEGIRRERERINLISSLFDEWIFEFDIKCGRIFTVSGNPSLYGLSIVDKDGKEGVDTSVVHADDLSTLINAVNPYSKEHSDDQRRNCEFRVKRNNDWVWLSFTSVCMRDVEGNPISVIGKISDIDKKKQEQLKLLEKAQKDSLTGLYNRETFDEKAKARIEAVKNEELKNLAILIIDIDNFKLINDNFGHLFGDLAIIDLTNALKIHRFPTDVVGRFGGDEFIIASTEFKDKDEVEKRIRDLRAEYTALMHEEYADMTFTCSIGVAFYGEDGTEYTELVSNADKALYFVKTHGRNNFMFCNQLIRDSFAQGEASESIQPIIAGENVSEELVQFALDLFESSSDIMGAVSILLARIGKRFGLSFVSLREKTSSGSAPVKYVWVDEKKTSFRNDDNIMSPADWVSCAGMFSGCDSIITYDIATMDEANPLRILMQSKGAKSFVKDPLIFGNEGFGCLIFGDCLEARDWTEDEIKSFAIVSRILSTYLVREKDYNRVQKEMNRMMSYDDLTSLLKVDKFKEVADQIISANKNDKYAVISSDISHFKFFNENFGFKLGDQLLRDFANIIIKHNPRIVAACRDYADNFLALIRVQDESKLEETIMGYCERFKITETRKLTSAQVEVNIGYYIIDEPSIDIAHAIDNASFAKKTLKESGANGIRRYEPDMKAGKLREVALLHTLEEALEDGQFEVFLQPQVSLSTGALAGAEALVRWRKPNGQLGYPDDFIPALEKSGKIMNLDYYVFEAVLRLLRRWKQENKELVPISVNFSRKHIKNEVFVPYLNRQTKSHSIDKKFVEIEITESAFVDDQVALIKVMNEISAAGFRLAVDDFGKGYSSLSMLNEVPADVIKIDKEFLKNYEDASQKAMLNNVIRLIKDASMTVVCEGIEEEEQARFLSSAGCDIGQGYWFGRPMPVEDFEERFMSQNNSLLND